MIDNDIFGLSEEKQDKQRTKAEQEQRQRDLADIAFILKHPQGRRTIWKMMERCGMFHLIFNTNAKFTDFYLGRRSIGLELLNEVNEVDAGAYAQMQAEYISEQKSKRKEKEKQNAV